MKETPHHTPFLGVALILIGAILLAASYFTGLSHLNFVLWTGLLIVTLGIVLHVWLLKRREKY